MKIQLMRYQQDITGNDTEKVYWTCFHSPTQEQIDQAVTLIEQDQTKTLYAFNWWREWYGLFCDLPELD